MTRVRLAASLGVPTARVAGWESGAAVPGPSEVRALARVFGLDAAEAAHWTEWCAGAAAPAPEATIAVEIVPAAHGDIFSPAPEPVGVGARRRADATERRFAHRRTNAARRRSDRAGDEARRARRSSGGAAPAPVFAPDLVGAHPRVAATVNSGAVFPVPGARRTVDRLTYSTIAPTYRTTPEERLVYRSRWMRLLLVMIALVALLWWAVTQLGDGWGAVLDLFRNEDPADRVGAVLWWLALVR
jgi:hypothetical protein